MIRLNLKSFFSEKLQRAKDEIEQRKRVEEEYKREEERKKKKAEERKAKGGKAPEPAKAPAPALEKKADASLEMSIAEESKLLESQAARPVAKAAPDSQLREEDLPRKEKEWEIERQFLEALFIASRKDESGLSNDPDALY